MKLNINGAEVTITVHGDNRKETESRTKAFICRMSSAFYGEADLMKNLGCPNSASLSEKTGQALYDALDHVGYFNGIK